MFVQHDPFRQLDSLFNQMNPRRPANSSAPMDAYRRNGNVWVHIDLPGVAADSLDISVERNVLSITATREWATEEGDTTYLAERKSGTFSRQVHLGDGLDADAIEADYHDGVLTLRIPVVEQAQPRRIAINTSSGATPEDPEAVLPAEEATANG